MLAGVIHQIMSGIATGGIYASVALALVMIYQATHHVNFAQGEMATFSTYIALACINAGFPYWVALLIAVVSGTVVGVVVLTRKGVTAGRQTKLPFGVFLAFGAVAAIFAGHPLIHWYSSQFIH